MPESLARGARRPTLQTLAARCLFALGCVLATHGAVGHGNVTPQAVDTTELPTLGEGWKESNPFSQNDVAIRIGTSAYNQNCARCHGLEAISGGIAPDLRKLDNECAGQADTKKSACKADMDAYFITTVRHGRTRNGAVYMPPFEGALNQEAIWSIKSYLETRRDRPL